MTQEKNSLQEKRQKALEKLQSNRGKKRTVTPPTINKKTEGLYLFTNNNQEITEITDDLNSISQEIDINELKPDSLPKIAKASVTVKKRQEKMTEAIKRLKETRQKIKKNRKEKQQKQEVQDKFSEDQNLEVNRHQLKQDILTADFWQQASQWLSGINTDIYLSSTPKEEIELLYKQAKHRYKALKLMLEDTEKELDAFEAYFRNLDSLSDQKNKPE